VHLVGFIIRIYHDARQIRRNECLLEALGIDEIFQKVLLRQQTSG